ncbi:MAG TPA: ATP synthase subunit I [Terriglobia bacterium]|nr:ATP synthase subunit I [Terriglobia bacterium]
MQTEIIRTSDPNLDLARAQARLPWLMIDLCVAVSFAAVSTGHFLFAAGFAFGAALAILNFHWLHQTIGHLFAAGQTRLPWLVITKFVVRYPLAFAALYLFYRTGWLPFSAIIAGLFVPVGGILIEAVFQIHEGLRT